MKNIAVTVGLSIAALALMRQIIPAGFLLYQGVSIGAGFALIQGVLQWRRHQASRSSTIKDAALSFFVVYAFVFTVPTTVDRSYSVRMIDLVAASRDGVSRQQVEEMYQVYFTNGGGVDRRLDEQLATGTIAYHDGRYQISGFGSFLGQAFHVTEIVFRCGSQA